MMRDFKLVVAWAGGLFSGLVLAVGGTALAADVDATYAKLRVFSQVLAYVQTNYVDEVGEEELVYDAVNGMLANLDPHTVFMRPEEYRKLREDTAGEFGGLGVGLVEEAPGDIRVERVIPDGAADRAGLRVGDRILAVDGEAVAGLGALSDVASELRGVPGTKVELRVMRKGWSKPREVLLIRRHVRVDSVESELLPEGLGYVRIYSFQERTDHELGQALAELRKEAKGGLRGLILDLRDNPGGLLDEGVKVADRFIREGEIVSTRGRNPRNVERQRAHEAGTEVDYPLAILVNGGSASASEIVAGALQDHKRGLIVGSRSFGKGSVQTLFGLDDGSGLKLTIARYYTPSGRSIQGAGIEPDVVALPTSEGPELGAIRDTRLRTDSELATAWEEVRKRAKNGKNLARQGKR